MSKHYKILFALVLVGFISLGIPEKASAAQVYFKIVPNPVATDNSTLVEARINPQSKNLNTVEGGISFTGSASENLSVQIDTKDSILSLWPGEPIYNSADKTISFIGGTPGGFDKDSLLFQMRLSASVTGSTNIAWQGGTAYLNNGKGTKDSVSAGTIAVNLNKQVWNDKDQAGKTNLSAGSENQQQINGDKVATSDSNDFKKNVTIKIIILCIVCIALLYAYKRNFKK
jgi:hypothetical protein